MVIPAQQHQILELRLAVAAPPDDVVCVAPGDLAVAVREPAATIAGNDHPEQVRRHRPGGTPVVGDGRRGAQDPVDHTVTQERIRRPRRHELAVGGDRAGTGDGIELTGLNVELDMWTMPGGAGTVVVGVEEPDDVDQGPGVALRG